MPWAHRSFWIGPVIIAVVLGLLLLLFSRGRLRRVYEERRGQTHRDRLFLACVGFFTAVLVVRFITIAIHYDVGPFHNVTMRGRHIHHLVWGILLLLMVGYTWLVQIGTGLASARGSWAGSRLC